MAINGLTDKDAALPSLGVLRKGEKKTDESRPGKDLTYFRFVSEDDLANQMFVSAYPDEDALRNINVFLPYKTTQENMVDGTWIEKWVAGGLVYRSDGEKIVLWRAPKGGFSTEPKPDPKPEILEDGKRADGSMQVGRLTVIVPELRRLMTVTVLTTSKWDIINLTRQLRSYETLEGDLRGIPFVLRRKLETISTPMKGGKRARRQKWLLSIETLPRYTMPKIAAMERAALPANVEGEIIDSNDYTIHELPLNIIAPLENGSDEIDRTDPLPEPAQATTTNGNGKSKKERPLNPADVYDGLHRRAEDDGGNPATKAQIGLVASKIEECFAPDKDAKGKRLTVLHWLWNVESAKELTFKQAKVTLDWLLLSGEKDSGGDYPLHPAAPEEAQRIYHEAMIAAGQKEMPLEEAPELAEVDQPDLFDTEPGNAPRGGGAAYSD